MYVFKVKSDKAGSIYKEGSFELEIFDLIGPDPRKKQMKLKLTKPKDAYIKVLTFSLNKVVKNVELTAGKEIKTGPYPLVEGKNLVSFDGKSDTPDADHEIQLDPQWLS
jgi:hypothetical protein